MSAVNLCHAYGHCLQVVSVVQAQLAVRVFQLLWRETFQGGLRCHRHEHRKLNWAMREMKDGRPGLGGLLKRSAVIRSCKTFMTLPHCALCNEIEVQGGWAWPQDHITVWRRHAVERKSLQQRKLPSMELQARKDHHLSLAMIRQVL